MVKIVYGVTTRRFGHRNYGDTHGQEYFRDASINAAPRRRIGVVFETRNGEAVLELDDEAWRRILKATVPVMCARCAAARVT